MTTPIIIAGCIVIPLALLGITLIYSNWTRMKFKSLFKSDILNVAGITGIYSSP